LVELDEFAFNGEADGHGGWLRNVTEMLQERRIVSEPTRSANPQSAYTTQAGIRSFWPG
jgi:hypothetical protein